MKRIALLLLLLAVVLSGCTGKEVAAGIMGMPCELLFNGGYEICGGVAYTLLDVAAKATTHNDRYDPNTDTDPEVESYTCTDIWCQPVAEPAINIELYTCSDNWCRPTVGTSALDT